MNYYKSFLLIWVRHFFTTVPMELGSQNTYHLGPNYFGKHTHRIIILCMYRFIWECCVKLHRFPSSGIRIYDTTNSKTTDSTFKGEQIGWVSWKEKIYRAKCFWSQNSNFPVHSLIFGLVTYCFSIC